ncbi:hypothetical protein [Calidithermus timidus]|jgi:hypothetical protein|uniref:hypothetical protein n=1 Tax=Calidithermus timidus TaxID=307124 RepID=UPI00036E75C9|nr:hypothetical protein [Calidithermus timidus]
MRRFLLSVALGGLLAACSGAPLSIAITVEPVDVSLISDGAIYFQKAGQMQKPPVGVKEIGLEGTANFTDRGVLHFYATDQEPDCPIIGSFFRCSSPSAATMDDLGTLDFSKNSTSPLKWSGAHLTNGVNNQTLYIGVKLESLGLTSGRLSFENLVAKVVLF